MKLTDELLIKIAKDYIADKSATTRSLSARYNISKSCIHKALSKRLKYIHPGLYSEVKKKLEYNKSDRHRRGGEATRLKWELLREDN